MESKTFGDPESDHTRITKINDTIIIDFKGDKEGFVAEFYDFVISTLTDVYEPEDDERDLVPA